MVVACVMVAAFWLFVAFGSWFFVSYTQLSKAGGYCLDAASGILNPEIADISAEESLIPFGVRCEQLGVVIEPPLWPTIAIGLSFLFIACSLVGIFLTLKRRIK